MSDIQSWWGSLPIVTKYLFVGSFGLTLAGNFGLINPSLLILHWPLVYKNFQLWRLITCFLFHGKLGFPFLIHMMFLVTYAGKLESQSFGGRLSDYLYFIIIGCVLMLITSWFMGFPILAMGLIMMLIYYWARKNPDVTMSFFFGLKFKSIYFPWVLVGFNVLMGGWPVIYVVGIVIGHFYFFFADVYPRTSGGTQWLKTPQFLYDVIPPEYNSFVPAQQQRRQNNYFGGRGQALGGR